MNRRVLLVEPERTHGQVLIPLVQDLLDQECRVHLVLRRNHADLLTLEAMSASLPEFTMDLERFESNRRLLPWALTRSLRGWDAVIVMTVKPRRWFLPFLLGLRHGRVSTFFHNTDWFPSPAARSGHKAATLLISSLLHRLLVVSHEVAQRFRREIPDRLRRRVASYSPLPGREASQAPTIDRPTFVVPGALEPRRRNYASLLHALRSLPPRFPGQVRLVGSLRRSDPGLLRDFRELGSVDLSLQDWHSYSDLLLEVSQAHFVLPLLSGIGFKLYSQNSASSAVLWADGLARPMVVWDEVDLDEANLSRCLRYGATGTLAEALVEGCRQVSTGNWTELHQQALKRRAALRKEALETLVDVCGGRE